MKDRAWNELTEEERKQAFRSVKGGLEPKPRRGLEIIDNSELITRSPLPTGPTEEERRLRTEVQRLEVTLATTRAANIELQGQIARMNAENPIEMLKAVTPEAILEDRIRVPANLRMNQMFWLTRVELAILEKLSAGTSKQRWLRAMIVSNGKALLPGQEQRVVVSEIGPARKPGRQART